MSRFEGLYEKYLDAVFRYSLRQVGRRDLAEDITSEVFLRLYQNLERVEDEQLPAWLLRVARNKAVDHWRHEAVAQRHENANEGPSLDPGPSLSFETILSQNASLKPIHRFCLILRYVHGLSRGEIARKTGLAETQIKGHLQYALKLLRESLSATQLGE